MNETGIEWTDETWNCIRGCSRVSEGCRHCYAEQIAGRFSDEGQAFHGYATRKLVVIDDDRQRHEGRWTGKIGLVPSALFAPLHRRRPRRIFVNSMSDLFHEGLAFEDIAVVYAIMAACPQHTFQVLTKRARRRQQWQEWMAQRARALGETIAEALLRIANTVISCGLQATKLLRVRASDWGLDIRRRVATARWPLSNVWEGVSVENQDAANERIPWLTRTSAAVHFLSCEPLLGPIDLRAVDGGVFNPGWLDWVIVGCESGIGARTCQLAWVRSLREQCHPAVVALFVKQLEADDNIVDAPVDGVLDPIVLTSGRRVVAAVAGHPEQHKRIAGRRVISLPFLDGVQHAAFPRARAAV